MGIDSKITIERDGAAVMELVYRVSAELQKLGGQDGNERWLSIPVGRADFERSAARISGMSVESFSSRIEGNDRVERVRLKFSGTDALMAFLSGALDNASLSSQSLRLTLSRGGPLDPDTRDLVQKSAEGYKCRISVQSSLNGSVKNFNYEIPMGELLSSEKELVLDIPL
jgi:hypothetical protein